MNMTITNKQKVLFNIISDLAPIILVAISLTRIWTISLFYIFGKDSLTIDRIINDPWHHYQVGLMLVVVALLIGKLKRLKLLFAIGLGIFLEEWPKINPTDSPRVDPSDDAIATRIGL